MNPQSVFDLSPSEKLQLVEDLWDDLAANPENVPVHDWQLKELESRKAKLKKRSCVRVVLGGCQKSDSERR